MGRAGLHGHRSLLLCGLEVRRQGEQRGADTVGGAGPGAELAEKRRVSLKPYVASRISRIWKPVNGRGGRN